MVKELSEQGKTPRNGIKTTKHNGITSNNKVKTHYLNFGEEDQMVRLV
jgi:hypothetical protein